MSLQLPLRGLVHVLFPERADHPLPPEPGRTRRCPSTSPCSRRTGVRRRERGDLRPSTTGQYLRSDGALARGGLARPAPRRRLRADDRRARGDREAADRVRRPRNGTRRRMPPPRAEPGRGEDEHPAGAPAHSTGARSSGGATTSTWLGELAELLPQPM